MQNNKIEAERLHGFVGHKQFDVFNLASSEWNAHKEKATAYIFVRLTDAIQLPFWIQTRPLFHLKVKIIPVASQNEKTRPVLNCFSIGR